MPPPLIALCLGLAASAVYWPVAGFEFTNYDDPEYFSENPHVLGGLSWASLKWALGTTEVASWYPVTWLSFLLDATVFGKGPRGPHLVNLLLHAANAVLLFVLLRHLTGARWKSALVAGLFALHPLHVEAVAWIAERKGLLSAFFGLLSLCAYGRYAQVRGSRSGPSQESPARNNRVPDRNAAFPLPSSFFYCLALVLFALGLMSKPILVTLPFVMLLLDYWPLKRVGYPFLPNAGQEAGHYWVNLWRLLLEKVPFLGVAVLSSAITVWVHQQAGAIQSLALLSLKDRLENAVVSYARYMGKMVWPADLALPYPHPGHWPPGLMLVAAGLVVGASVAALRLGRRYGFVFSGWFWFLGTLLPVIGIIQWGGQAMADRFMYVPSIGLFTIVVWTGGELAGRGPRPKWLVPAVGLLMLGGCAFQAWRQVHYWHDSERLFRHTLAVTRNNVVAHNSLGFHYVTRDRPEEAEKSFRAALGIQPNKYSWHGLGSALVDQRKYAGAVAACEAALTADPYMAKAHSTLGVALTRLGQTNDAMSHYREALRLQPELAAAHYNLANALASQGRIGEAREHFAASVRSDPGSADAHNNLAYMLVREGSLTAAEAEFRSALALRPGLWQARYGLAGALVQQGKAEEAIQHYREILALKPDFVETLTRLAWLLAVHPDPQVRNGLQAVELAERACQLTQYRHPATLRSLAAAYAESGRFTDAIRSAQESQRLAQLAGQTELAHRNQQLLEVLQGGHPYREETNPRSAKSQ